MSRTLADWSDTRGLARKYAEAKSLEMMKRFVADASPAEILKMQAKLDVVREDRIGGGDNNLVVMFNPEPPPIELFRPLATVAVEPPDGDAA